MTTAKENMWEGLAKATSGARVARLPDPEPAPTPDLPLFVIEVLDVDAVREIDPLMRTGRIFRLAAPWTEPVVVQREGRDLFRLTPTDRGQEAADLAADVYDLVVDSLGVAPSGAASSEEWMAEASAWAAGALVELPTLGIQRWRGEERARRMQIADRVAHSHNLGPDAASIAGAPPPPAKTLWSGQDAARLAEAKRQREAAAKAKAEKAAAVVLEDQRPRTVGETRIVAVAVRVDRLGSAFDPTPWHGAQVLWHLPTETVYGFRILPACSMPSFERDGVRRLGYDEVVPRDAAQARDAGPGGLAFLRARRVEAGVDFGPMRTTSLRTQVPELAMDAARSIAPVILGPGLDGAWRTDFICELLVRSSDLRLRPDVALALLLDVLDETWKATHPPARIPVGELKRDFEGRTVGDRAAKLLATYAPSELPSHTMAASLGARLVAAVERGQYVGVNEPMHYQHPAPRAPSTIGRVTSQAQPILTPPPIATVAEQPAAAATGASIGSLRQRAQATHTPPAAPSSSIGVPTQRAIATFTPPAAPLEQTASGTSTKTTTKARRQGGST